MERAPVPIIAGIICTIALAGCSQLKLDDGCTYTRTITTSYQCPEGGSMEHRRLAPWNPEL